MSTTEEINIIQTIEALRKKGVTVSGRVVNAPRGLGLKTLGKLDALKRAGYFVAFRDK